MHIGAPVVLTEAREGFDRSTGRFIEYIYRGSAAAVLSVARGFEPIAKQTVITANGKTKTLIVRFDRDPRTGSIDRPQVEFRLVPTEHFKDILESEFAAGISDDDIRAVREAIQSPQEGVSPAVGPEAGTIYNLMLDGVRSVPVFQPTLIMVRTAPGGYFWRDRPTNVGNIYSEAQMLEEVRRLSGARPSFRNALPTGTTARSGMDVGWRKKMPSYDQVAGGHTQETIEYEYGVWSTSIYTAAVI